MSATKDATARILTDRLEKLEVLNIGHGGHRSREQGMCLLEAVAYVAGREHTDHPPCVSPVLGAFGRAWNDALPDDEARGRLLKPLVRDMIGTNTGMADDDRRAWIAADWLVRTYAPAWLRLAGLDEQAKLLESMTELSPKTTPAILPVLHAVRDDAQKSYSAAESAAESAARSAAGSAAWSAAESAAESAARSAAWSAAWSAAESAAESAAGSAARSAARDKLQPTVEKLQASAQDLLRRMAAVGRLEVVEVAEAA